MSAVPPSLHRARDVASPPSGGPNARIGAGAGTEQLPGRMPWIDPRLCLRRPRRRRTSRGVSPFPAAAGNRYRRQRCGFGPILREPPGEADCGLRVRSTGTPATPV